MPYRRLLFACFTWFKPVHLFFSFFFTVLTTLPKIYKRFYVVVNALALLHFSLLHKSVGGAQKKRSWAAKVQRSMVGHGEREKSKQVGEKSLLIEWVSWNGMFVSAQCFCAFLSAQQQPASQSISQAANLTVHLSLSLFSSVSLLRWLQPVT